MNVSHFMKKILFFTCVYGKGSTLTCMTCSTVNRTECLKYQTEVDCRSTQQACLTMQYTSEINMGTKVISETVYKKTCISSNLNCALHCRSIYHVGDKQCKVSCCRGNRCNKDDRSIHRYSFNRAYSTSFIGHLFVMATIATFSVVWIVID